MTSRLLRTTFGLALGLLTSVTAASADTWPSRVISLVVPFGTGSGTDVIARIIAGRLTEILGKQIIVEDIGGAGGTIGITRVAKEAPDGYHFVIGAVDTFAQSQYLFENPPSDTMKDFEPVALAVEQPLVLLTRKTLPVSNLKDFVTYLKAHQTEMRFGSAGIGAAPYLACAMITRAAGAKAIHVPYRAAAPALRDMIAGDIDYYCPLAVSAVPFMTNDTVKTLAVLTANRSPVFPDLPTAREQGVEVVDGYYWNAFFVPKGTPPEIVKKLSAAISTALDDKDVQAKLHVLAATVVAPDRRSPEYLRTFLGKEITKWSRIMKENNVPRLKR
ncbi:MAG: tripartite tricarboxylate transporter substrate binding protein [Pseudolabrys sp.]